MSALKSKQLVITCASVGSVVVLGWFSSGITGIAGGQSEGSVVLVVEAQREAARNLALHPSFEQRSWFGLVQFLLSQPPRRDAFEIVPDDVGVDTAVGTVEKAVWDAVTAQNDRTGVEIHNADAMVGEYRVVLAAYLKGTRRDIESYRIRRGEPEVVARQACGNEEVWADALRTLKGAKLSVQTVIVRPRILDGVRVPTEDTLAEGGTSIRYWQFADAVEAPPAHVMTYEVIIGVEAKDSTGEPFSGYLGIWMTHGEPVRPGDGARPEWICTQVTIYNTPAGVGIVQPYL